MYVFKYHLYGVVINVLKKNSNVVVVLIATKKLPLSSEHEASD
jgi:hypothetical protein